MAFLEAFPTRRLCIGWQTKVGEILHTERPRPQTYEKRMEIFARATGFVSGQALRARVALARARMLRGSR
jgi:hypothetical protein